MIINVENNEMLGTTVEKKLNKYLIDLNTKQYKEIERLRNIIKEVREYMGNYSFIDDIRIMDYKEYQELLEILDKENK